jgi:hypothetical protein
MIFSSLLQIDKPTKILIKIKSVSPIFKKMIASWIKEKNTLHAIQLMVESEYSVYNIDLASAIQSRTTLTSLGVCNLLLPGDFFKSFMEQIASSTVLQSFLIIYNASRVNDPSDIFTVLEKNRFANSLFFVGCAFQQKDINAFVFALKRNTILSFLSLKESRDNILITPALENLANHPTIKHLEIKAVRKGLNKNDTPMILYENLLPRLENLQTLELNAGIFRDIEELKSFATGLQHNKSIKILTIEETLSNVHDWSFLFDVLCYNTTLQKFSLPKTYIPSRVYPSLEKLLSVNFTLAVLELRSLRISKNLLRIMKKNFTLWQIKTRFSHDHDNQKLPKMKKYLHRNQRISFLKTATLFELLFPRIERYEQTDRLRSLRAKKGEKRTIEEISQPCSSSDSVISLD